jgi:hypothetical protein
MPKIETWIPLTGHLITRAGETGGGDPDNPVNFSVDTSSVSLNAGEEVSMQWLDVDWDVGQVKVSIEAPARVMALFKSRYGIEAASEPLSGSSCTTMLGKAGKTAMTETPS